MPVETTRNQRQFPPKAADSERLALGQERWRESLGKLDDSALVDSALAAAETDRGRALVAAVFGNSPFLTQCILKQPAEFVAVANGDADGAFKNCLSNLETAARAAPDQKALDRALRQARTRAALITALADLDGVWSVQQVTRALSDFADAAVGHALRFHFSQVAERATGADVPLTGLFVLAMGKLGARELNYSSDIDLIVLFDPERMAAFEADELSQHMVRVTRGLVASLNDRTEDGYVFRVDLRLRPDPGSTPVAISVPAAETYYEAMGQNWERAAMIRARPSAGDLEAGAAFLKELTPFVWRRSMDFYAIQDVHSIKRQIHAQRGGGAVTVSGHNIKLGRGGIREIEFFVQTQQLIYGGRDPELRSPDTCAAMQALADDGRIAQETADDLADSYRYLREIEHRLQMVDDQQTQIVPAEEDALDRFATFAGYSDRATFEDELTRHLLRVESHYADLFEEAPSLSSDGSLSFTGSEHDPDTLETLAGKGFADPEAVSNRVRGWHHGRYRATRSARAREILTELTPAVIDAFSQVPDPDRAFARFDDFLSRLPAGVQILSLLHANPALLRLLAEIIGIAPRLADTLSRRPALIEFILDAGIAGELPKREELQDELAAQVAGQKSLELVLDAVRRWTADRWFQIGVQLLRGTVTAAEAGQAYARVADTAIGGLLPEVLSDFALRHGSVPGSRFAVLALGKLGSRELTASSDLDLVFIYDAPESSTESDGEKALSVSHYFARFAQRLFNALTAPTSEGVLFDVDMRLRPFGEQGPLASSFEAFRLYQEDKAWTWEKMALTRARFVAGDDSLGAELREFVISAFRSAPNSDDVTRDVIDMRARIRDAHPATTIWRLKHARGGIVDLEFVIQFLYLTAHERPASLLTEGAEPALQQLIAAGALDADTGAGLAQDARLILTLQALLRLTSTDEFDPATAPTGLKDLLASATERDTFEQLEASLRDAMARVAQIYDRIIGDGSAPD